MDEFFRGFEKRAALSPATRAAYEKEMHEFNKSQTTPGKLIPKGLKSGTIGGGLIGGVGGGVAGAIAGGATKGPKGALIGGLLGAAGGGLQGAAGGAAIGGLASGVGSAFGQMRGKDYLKKIPDSNLERGVKGIRKFQAGDSNAVNRAYWETMERNATNPRDKAVFKAMRDKEI